MPEETFCILAFGPFTAHPVNSVDCLMPILRVKINDSVWVNAALETFSSSTFCSQSLADQLKMPGHYTLKTMHGSSPVSSKQVTFKVASDDQSMIISGVKVVKYNPVSTPPPGIFKQNEYEHSNGLDLLANIDCRKVI